MKTGTKDLSKQPITPEPFNPIHRDLIIVLITSVVVAALLVWVVILLLG